MSFKVLILILILVLVVGCASDLRDCFDMEGNNYEADFDQALWAAPVLKTNGVRRRDREGRMNVCLAYQISKAYERFVARYIQSLYLRVVTRTGRAEVKGQRSAENFVGDCHGTLFTSG